MDKVNLRAPSEGMQPLISGDRKVINMPAHGASVVSRQGADNLNVSIRYDQHFDSQRSHDLSFDHFSSRGGVLNPTGADIRESIGNLKRSDTDTLIRPTQQAVTFASAAHNSSFTRPGVNHPMHYRGDNLERIEENNKTPYMGAKQGYSRQPSAGAVARLATDQKKAHFNDVSQLTINSTKLDESVKAPGRPPQRIKGLTQYLVDLHYKKFGVFTKAGLFEFWKDYVSVIYRLRKFKQSLQQKGAVGEPLKGGHESFARTATATAKSNSPQRKRSNSPSKQQPNEDLKLYDENANYETMQEINFALLYEMDVAYTIQIDLDEENDENKKTRFIREQEAKKAWEQRVREEELSYAKWAIESYYIEVKNYLMGLKDYDHKDQNRYFHTWQNETAENLLGSSSLGLSVAKTGQENKEPNVSQLKEEEKQEDSKGGKTEELRRIAEITKKAENQSEREKLLNDQIKDEATLMMNLMVMLRDKGVYTNDPSQILRAYLDCSDKQRHGIIFGSDDKAHQVIRNFFQCERVFKRLQILYLAKIKYEGKYKHLSLFGFYKQLTKQQRILQLIDWPQINSPSLVVAKVDKSDPKKQHDKLSEKLIDDDDMKRKPIVSVEELCVRFETLVKVKRYLQDLERTKQLSESHKQEREKLLSQVFGKQKKKEIEKRFEELKSQDHLKILAKPKDKWKRLKILMELKKKFKHDMVLEKMIKEELKSNRVFKFPEEYDLYDDEEDRLCKHMSEEGIKVKPLSAGRSLREKFKTLDDQELYYLNQEISKKQHEEARMQKFLIKEALEYLEQKKKRLQGQETTVRKFVSDVYRKLVDDFPKITNERFPHVNYGTKKDSETYKKSYPHSFKNYFFQLVKSHFKQKKGIKRIRNPASTFILAAGKRCIYHENMACPEGCPHATFNKKVMLQHTRLRKYFKEPLTFRSRVWRRNDFKEALEKVLMTNSEIENCTFEPEAGSMSKTIGLALRANPGLRKEGLLDEPDPENYVKKLGKDFAKAHPEVYKAGVLKRAMLMFKEGKFDDALKRLYDGFNVDSIRKRFDPVYMKRLIIEKSLKKIQLGGKNKDAAAATGLQRIAGLKDEPDSQKKMPEEDFENMKLLPILRQAFGLIDTIEKRKEATENRIKKVERQQMRLKKSLTSFSVYKRSQTRAELSKGDKILFRTIMCPLREKCPKDMRPRWPTSNTKSVTKFGEECPFAHHQMELKFPESIITKLSSTRHTIKNLRGQIDSQKPKEVFRPTGPLHDCEGCNSKSSKHIGGPCNLCRYKEMAKLSSAKFSDKERAKSFRRSLSKRETRDEKEDQNDMNEIMKLLNLDKNFTIKFGLLKKACVLFFYARYNDAFDQVAKAAKIIQDQREIEKQKQQVIEKRWKFKLGLDDGFEFPMPIDQIDPAKVDEKFLKKLDLQGVAVSTLKLYIEQVAPQAREEYSKHAFLNKCIEDFYLQCEEMLEDKQNTIKKMKKQVEKLDEDADMLEAFGSSPERSPEKGAPGERRVRPKKTKMCPNMENKGGCSLPSWKCHYAHNPIELDLIPIETKMKNLQGVIQSQTQKLKNMKPLEPWRPVKSGEVIHTHLMDMSSKGKKKKGAEGDDDEDDNRRKEVKRKSIFDRENIFRKPYEQNE